MAASPAQCNKKTLALHLKPDKLYTIQKIIMLLCLDCELMWINSIPGNDSYRQKCFDFIIKNDEFLYSGMFMVNGIYRCWFKLGHYTW
jgi:hypothetical protein